MSASSALDHRFRISERDSTVRTELLGGVATFLTMSYIVFVNPAILSAAGLPFGAVAVATALAAAVFTAAMGLLANMPLALASGLGINAIVAFDLVLGRGLEWPVAMACIVLEGAIAVVLVLGGMREAVLRAVPLELKLAIGVGIGLFIALVGLREGGIVVKRSGHRDRPRRPQRRRAADRAGRHPGRRGAQRAQRARSRAGRHPHRHRTRPGLRRARRSDRRVRRAGVR